MLHAAIFATMALAYSLLMRIAEGIGARDDSRRETPMSLPKAREITEILFRDSTRLRAKRGYDSWSQKWDFGPLLADFFAQYEEVREPGGWVQLGREFLGVSTSRSGYIKIGEGFDGLELATLPGDDRIFLLNPNSPDDEPTSEPTIYHLLANALSE
jgi:hypothetical protein